MKSYELQPTYENLLNTYLNDTIARNIDVFRFAEILNFIDDSCSIALDGGWGSGKTFFVKQVKMVMDAHNDFIVSDNDTDREKIKGMRTQHRKNQSAEFQTQVSVYYDSWENDNDEDPVLSLVYSILQSVESDYSFKNGADCLQIAANILEFFSGKKWTQLINSFKSEDPLQKLRKEKGIQEMIKEFLDSLLLEKEIVLSFLLMNWIDVNRAMQFGCLNELNTISQMIGLHSCFQLTSMNCSIPLSSIMAPILMLQSTWIVFLI